MAHLMRLHNNKGESHKGWCETRLYPRDIDNIKDYNAAYAAKQQTAIPSPFAHLHQVKRAFSYIAQTQELEGNTRWHKLASEALDIGQILFEWERWQDYFKLIAWNKQDSLQKLQSSAFYSHPRLARVLNRYLHLEVDYGVDKPESVVLLQYRGANQEGNCPIVGGISHLTMYYASPQLLSYIGKEVLFDSHAAFSNRPTSLLQRSDEFNAYLFAFRASLPDFYQCFPELSAYLDLVKCRREVKPALLENSQLKPILIAENKPVTLWGVPCQRYVYDKCQR